MVEKTIGNKKGNSVEVNYTLADSCADTTVVGATSSVSWLTATASTPSNHAGTITITATEDGSDVTRYAFITTSINGEPCDNNRIKITQSPGEPPEPGVLACYRGTDNGTDYYKDGTKQSHPILLCGNIGSSDGDSIYVEGGLEYSIDNKASWHQLTQGEGFKPASWVRVYLEDIIGCCGNPYIGIKTVEEFNASGTELERSVTFWFKAHTYPEDGLVPACAAVICDGPAGEELCKEWEYEIKQCAKGYYWCGDNSYAEKPIPCGQECSGPKQDCKGKCGGGGEGCDVTLTISGLEGSDKASIYWDNGATPEENKGNGTYTHHYDTGGDHQVTVDASNYITKTCTFNCDGTTEASIEMEKRHSGCGNCDDFNMHSVYSNEAVPNAGGSNITLGTFKSDCEFEGTITATKMNGNMSITELGVKYNGSNNYSVTGNVAENSDSSEKTANIGVFLASEETPCGTVDPKQFGEESCECSINISADLCSVRFAGLSYSSACGFADNTLIEWGHSENSSIPIYNNGGTFDVAAVKDSRSITQSISPLQSGARTIHWRIKDNTDIKGYQNINFSNYCANPTQYVYVLIKNKSTYNIQSGHFYFKIGDDTRDLGFGGGITPGTGTRTAGFTITYTNGDFSKRFTADSVIASGWEGCGDCEMTFTCNPDTAIPVSNLISTSENPSIELTINGVK